MSTRKSDALWRFPAEWEPTNAVVLAWPHAGTDWAPWLASVEQTYVALARAILQRARLILLVRDKALESRALRLIDRDQDVSAARLRTTRFDYDDTWLRDTGPISLIAPQALMRWLDFHFTGWGGKYGASKDDKIVAHLTGLKEFSSVQHLRQDFALEGGAIESDGAGTVLSTWNCLSKRHPDKSRAQVEKILCEALCAKRVLMLHHGELAGDDTDAHIDTLARFASESCIVFQGCDDPSDAHFAPLAAMREELKTLRRSNGLAYQLVELPWAPAIFAADGRRLAASYANYLVINGAVLMPGYDEETDVAASMQLSLAFASYEIVVVPSRPLIEQNGSLHCVTMQIPAAPDSAPIASR